MATSTVKRENYEKTTIENLTAETGQVGMLSEIARNFPRLCEVAATGQLMSSQGQPVTQQQLRTLGTQLAAAIEGIPQTTLAMLKEKRRSSRSKNERTKVYFLVSDQYMNFLDLCVEKLNGEYNMDLMIPSEFMKSKTATGTGRSRQVGSGNIIESAKLARAIFNAYCLTDGVRNTDPSHKKDRMVDDIFSSCFGSGTDGVLRVGEVEVTADRGESHSKADLERLDAYTNTKGVVHGREQSAMEAFNILNTYIMTNERSLLAYFTVPNSFMTNEERSAVESLKAGAHDREIDNYIAQFKSLTV